MSRHRVGYFASLLGVSVALGLLAGGGPVHAAERPATFCNPLDLDYRFQPEGVTRREAADPAIVYFHKEYWLFASKSGGYWHSPDFAHWTFVSGKELPIEDYAPAVVVIKDQLYFTAFDTKGIYHADDLAAGHWTKVGDLKGYPDPGLFADADGKVYVVYGCSSAGGISVVELDPANRFHEVGKPVEAFKCDPPSRGWEVRGDDNAGTMEGGKLSEKPYIEGAWLTKWSGKYYLQYAGPGTQFRSYADGVYVAEAPMGPYKYAAYSPFSHKPTGFATGAGHSAMFQAADGGWWHVSTMVICQRHMFERRLGVFPAGFCPDGQLYCDTSLGDYPQYLPGSAAVKGGHGSPGWMLLSRAKTAEASSALPKFPVQNAFDENIQTWWCAATGNAGEWLKVDLGKVCRIEALQINFADEGAEYHRKLKDDAYQYYVEVSRDGEHWQKILDRADNHRDAPQDYAQLEQPVKARYARLVNVHCPAGAKLSVSGFRIFGNGLARKPAAVEEVNAMHQTEDARKAVVSWTPAKRADFYMVRLGLAPDRLFDCYQVYDAADVKINSLNRGVPYYFTVDAVNDSGVTPGHAVIRLDP